MRNNFFEEYPSEKNLKKLELIKFPTTIYFATKSLKEFEGIQKKVFKKNPLVKSAYWPILKKSYWISPFSNTNELKKLYDELNDYKKDEKLNVLIDLELPFLKKRMFLKNTIIFFQNKKIIKKIIKKNTNANTNILTAEYPSPCKLISIKLKMLGVSYNTKKFKHEKLVMYYTSMIKNKFLKSQIKKQIKKETIKENLHIGLGTIARGALGREPILTPK